MGKKRLNSTTSGTAASNIGNCYGQPQQHQQLVIPGWSTGGNPGLGGPGQCGGGGGQGGQPDAHQNGLVRDWNWRPELAYSGSTAATLEGLTMDFGIVQQRLFPTSLPSRPDLNAHMSASSAASGGGGGGGGGGGAAGGSSLTVPKASKPRRPKNTGRGGGGRNADNNLHMSKGTEEVVEKFVWGGKWECEKLANNEFVCCACGAVKSNRPNLVTHLTYHRILESKRWACKFCDKAFCRQREVERHERTHLTKGKTQ